MNGQNNSDILGGEFILNPITNLDVFTREDFSEEHKEIYNMVRDFDREKILSFVDVPAAGGDKNKWLKAGIVLYVNIPG